MTLKKYQTIKLILTVLLAVVFSQCFVYKKFILMLIILPIVTLFLLWLRKKVKEVIADERDYEIGGRSALLAMQIFSWVGVVAMLIFYIFSDLNPYYEAVAITLAFSVCSFMLLYSLIFKFYSRVKFSNKKILYIFLGVLLIAVLTMFTVRVFSGEDTWNCENGSWVKHGNPNWPAPNKICQ